jgi:DNA-binding NarL/FixJ family response regulator
VRRLRILIADDHADARRLIQELLCIHFDVVGAVEDGRRLIEEAIQLRPDVIVSDVNMGALSGPGAMAELRSAGHDIPFVLISVETLSVEERIRQGAKGFVDKRDLVEELAPAIHSAFNGSIYLSRGARWSLLFRGNKNH